MTSFDLFQNLFALAVSEHPEQPLDCFRSERLHVGVYSLRRGDSSPTHRHDADQFYLVLRGKARVSVGEDTQELNPGGLAWAPAGEPHGIDEVLDDSVIVFAMAPPGHPSAA
jgi:quercetin dioxygenase-like cupin family protein